MSILDVIGPIMIGPSSSHTAGADKIGFLAKLVYGKEFKKVHITLYNSFAKTGKGHGTDKAIIGGLLGMKMDDERIPHAFDMRTTQLIFSGPEQALMAVAMTQMGKHYGLPVYINVGLTDSKTVDAQAGMEAGITLVLGAISGADIFGHLGISGVDQASSLAMLVMQDEVIGYVERIMRGIEVSEEKFGFDTIASVVSDGGMFLSQDHTVNNFRKELWFPTLLDRQFWQAWRDDNAKDMMQRCIEKKNMLLETHIPEPIDNDTQKEIEKVLNHAKYELMKET